MAAGGVMTGPVALVLAAWKARMGTERGKEGPCLNGGRIREARVERRRESQIKERRTGISIRVLKGSWI